MAYVADPEGNLIELLDRTAAGVVTGRLSGKIALITGVGGGMGVAAARRFAAEGARVVGCDLDEDGAARTEELVRAEGGEITVMGGVDLGDADAAREWVDAAVATYDGIDVLYNNASTQRFGAARRADASRTGTSRCATSSTSSTTRCAPRGRT